jgi:hypothetical protein
MYNSAKLQLEAVKDEREDLLTDNLALKKVLTGVQLEYADSIKDKKLLNYDREQEQVNKLIKSLKLNM